MTKRVSKRGLILRLTLYLIVCGVAGGLLLGKCFPEYWFGCYPFVPVFFYLMGLVLIRFLAGMDTSNPKRIMNRYLVLRGVKFLVALVLAALYALLVREQTKAFIVVFVVFYLLYMVFEVWTIYVFEQQLKERKRQ